MILWIGLGGVLGAIARYSVGIWIGKRAGGSFPWATLLVNVVGSFILGILAGSAERIPEVMYSILGIGFCGAFTTFSTFGYEAVSLAGNKRYTETLLYVFISLILGLAGAWAGLAITT